jgi:hypothetical protein
MLNAARSIPVAAPKIDPLTPTVPPAALPAVTTAVAAGGCRANLEKA